MTKMFESIKVNIEEECEECSYKDVLVDAIVDGVQKRICHRCMIANQAIILKKPHEIKEQHLPRRSVHEILEEMSGIKPKPIEKPSSQITLEDLRQRYEELKEKRLKESGVLQQRRDYEDMEEKRRFLQQEKEQQIQQQKSEAKEKIINFNIEATKHTKIRDLLIRMKKAKKEKPIEKEEEKQEQVTEELIEKEEEKQEQVTEELIEKEEEKQEQEKPEEEKL